MKDYLQKFLFLIVFVFFFILAVGYTSGDYFYASGNYFYKKIDSSGANRPEPRCPCDVDSKETDCPDSFTTSIYIGDICYDQYERNNTKRSIVYQLFNRDPTGWHDGNYGTVDANNCLVYGWAYDPDSPNDPIRIHIYVGGPAGSSAPVYQTWAYRYRPDLCSGPNALCNVGFEFALPSQYRDGVSRSIYVYAINAQGGNNPLLNGSPKSLACKPSSPPPPTLNVSCSVSPNPANTDQQVTFTADATGGTGSYSYSWSGACTGNSQTCQKSFSSAGTYTATVNVTSGSQTKSASCNVTVNQSSLPLQVSCSAFPNPVRVSESVRFVANVSGGSGSYSYSWSGACTGSFSECMKTFSLKGDYTAFLNVTSGSQSQSTFCSVQVISNLPIVITLPAVESL
jgi:hypothetical protein